MRVESFEHKLRRRDLRLRTFFRPHVEPDQFFHQTLNAAKRLQRVHRTGRVRQLNLAAQVEPLHHLVHVRAFEVPVVGFGDRSPYEFTSHVVRALHFAFVLQFELACNRRHGGIDIADAWHHQLLIMADGAAFGI